MADLSHRGKQILYAVISEFVATGQPVGSRTISKKAGIDLSPASIRNVLADLEDLGYLAQPHTSAGRVPTDKAFRLFIDALMRVQQLSAEDHERIRAHLESIDPGQVMRETGKLLSDLTGTAAVVVAPRADALTLRTLRFMALGQGEVLAVLVMNDGTVQNRFLHAQLEEAELGRMHNLLDEAIEGKTLREVRDLFARRLATERVQADAFRKRTFELGEAALSGLGEAAGEIVIEGQARLLEQPEFKNSEGMKQVMNALDEREQLIQLLDATIAAGGAGVVVGSEAGTLGGGQLSIVGAPYTDHGVRAGAVGVIGPTRMDYPKVVPLVSATANAVSALREGRSSGPLPDDED
ncbi:MAG TPA: heat-inducible transcriptional repressor HrcA [Polyangiaceae bacterium]|nr:heat-inducible transcriptional repressor HrcA [Polyangiaceae bacterium]